MTMTKSILALGFVASLFAAPGFAQDAAAPAEAPAAEAAAPNPEGVFVDEYGTSFTFSLCGDGTALCGVLNDIQGDSRTEENLAYVGQQVMQADAVAPNEWKGTVILNGDEAAATVTQTGPDTVDIEGCRGIFCSTLTFTRAA
jgi:uncharacterized protein (DUF2147 family)